MKWFRKTPPPARPIIKDPFAVIPLQPEDVTVKRDSRGVIHLRRLQPISGPMRRLAGWLRYDYSRKIALDENGTLYYELVDGTRTLRAIADRMTRATCLWIRKAGKPSPAPDQTAAQTCLYHGSKGAWRSTSTLPLASVDSPSLTSPLQVTSQ